MFEHVLSSGRIGKLELKNRFVMPAMDTSATDPSQEVNDRLIAYYRARAKGGFGLIITEYTSVDYPDGLATTCQLSLYDDRFIPGMAKLAGVIHEEGGRIFVQLQHPGRETSADITGRQPVAPSAIPSLMKGKGMPRALETDEIPALVKKFADAAFRAKKAGMDGVELQCGHGYLVAQFLSGISNKRIDQYGGSLLNRTRFAMEIVTAIKEACGQDFPLICRISGEEHINGGLTREDSAVIARELEKAGADAIHVSTGTVASVEWLIGPAALPNGFNLTAAKKIRETVKIPVIAVGRMTEPAMVDHAIADEIADFVSLGRASIADPEFPNKTAQGRVNEISPCVGCLSRCFYTEGVIPGDRVVSCMLNPFTGHEDTMKIEPAAEKKKVIVVGGGPGGLEAAWVAAAKGHQVILFEKSESCGGQLLAAAIPPGKQEMIRGIQFLLEMNKKYGVELRLACEATKEKITAEDPDVVILATGSRPIPCPVADEGAHVVQAIDLLTGKAEAGECNIIIGGGLVGLETAAFLVSQGYQATVVEMKEEVGKDLNRSAARFLLEELEERKVQILTSTALQRLTPEGAVCRMADGKEKSFPADCIVMAIGSRAYKPLEEELKESGCRLVTIGDAIRARKAFMAIEEGARAALDIR